MINKKTHKNKYFKVYTVVLKTKNCLDSLTFVFITKRFPFVWSRWCPQINMWSLPFRRLEKLNRGCL